MDKRNELEFNHIPYYKIKLTKFCNLEKILNSLHSFRNQELDKFPYKYTECTFVTHTVSIMHDHTPIDFQFLPCILSSWPLFHPLSRNSSAFRKQERYSLRLEKNRISSTFEILMTRSPLCNYRAANSQAKKITRKFPRY